jgi:hypothetical protein
VSLLYKIYKENVEMKKFLYFAILYAIGNVLVIGVLAGLISGASSQNIPIFIMALLFGGEALCILSILFYLHTQRK